MGDERQMRGRLDEPPRGNSFIFRVEIKGLMLQLDTSQASVCFVSLGGVRGRFA